MTRRIAIIGGGIAGLYTAWRLLEQNEEKASELFSVHIYEKECSIGGRIRSQKIQPVGFGAELGAMRFRRGHLLLNALIAKLGTRRCQFDFPPAVFYVRGRRLNSGEITQGRCWTCNSGGPFHLKPYEQGMSAVDLVKYAINELLKALNFPGLHQSKARQLKRKIANEDYDDKTWYYIKSEGTYQGLYLYQIGFWNLLQHFLSNEAYVMVHEVLSLESILGNWNAAEAIPWFLADFASDQYEMVPGGLSDVAEKLEAKLEEARAAGDADGSVMANAAFEFRKNVEVSEIVRIDDRWKICAKQYARHEDNTYILDGSGKQIESRTYRETYDDVILALPAIPLKNLNIKLNDENRWQPTWLDWVQGHRMIKIFLLYAEAWWMGDGFPGSDTGRIFTDLPLRQIYHFSPTWMGFHGLRQDRPRDERGLALVMASYSDEHYVSFWGPMLHPDPKLNLSVPYDQPYIQPSPKLSAKQWKEIKDWVNHIRASNPGLLARRRMVEKVHLMLQEIHGREIPHPILGIAQEWEAGWHTWIVGSRPWEKSCRHERVQPLENLYLCGEAFSPEQGWIEGALKSAEQVLEKMGVEKSDWLKNLHVDLPSYINPYKWLDKQEDDQSATQADLVNTKNQ